MKIISSLLILLSFSGCNDDFGIHLFKMENQTSQKADVTLTSGTSSLSFDTLDPGEESTYKRFFNPHKELILSVDFEIDSLDFIVDLSRGYSNEEGKYSLTFNVTDQGAITTSMGYYD